MDSFAIFFEHSVFWIVPSLLIAAFFAWLLYKKTAVFSGSVKKILGVLRFVLLALLLILLITPIIKQIVNQYEKPVLIIAVDNSTSVTASADSARLVARLNEIIASVDEDYILEYRTLSDKAETLENITFDNLSTDLNDMLGRISNDYENRNIAAVVVVSDGLFNQGMNPVYSKYAYPVYTLGTGDTTSYSDIGIQQLRYNKLSYQGNKIPLQAEISHERFSGETAKISVLQNGQTVAEKNIRLTQEKGVHHETFLIDAMKEGLQRYEVVVSSSVDEKNTANNSKAAFIDIVEGRKKILLIAPYPHPDIKALEAAITTNENYEFIQYIPVIDNRGVQQIINQPVDLVIMHQLPQVSMLNDPVWKKFSAGDAAKWWITGTAVNFNQFNQLNRTVKVELVGRNQADKVTAWYNINFNAFNLSAEIKSIFNSLPPVSVPFGKIEPTAMSSVLLKQQVGRVQTEKPLLVTSNTDDVREGVFLGNGLWQWRLYEYAQHQTHERFNELVIKTVQYLSTKEDKRKFRFYPVKNEFSEGEQVVFDSEVYNDLYEPVYDQQINVEVRNDEGIKQIFQFMTSKNNTRYAMSGLKPGIYTYRAETTFNNVKMEINGEFAVNRLDMENLYLTANFELLRELSETSGGRFFPLDQSEDLASHLNETDHKDRIQTSEDFLPLINIKWIGLLLLLLASSEWIARKYHGAY